MTFRVPSVRVYQELLTSTPTVTSPFFDLCVVGPCYQVERDVDCGKYILSTEDFYSKYVSKRSSADLDRKSVSVNLTSVYCKLWPTAADNGTVTVDNSNDITVIKGEGLGTVDTATTAEVVKGDIIDISFTNDQGTVESYSCVINAVKEDDDDHTFYYELKSNLMGPLQPDGNYKQSFTATAVVKRAANASVHFEPGYDEEGNINKSKELYPSTSVERITIYTLEDGTKTINKPTSVGAKYTSEVVNGNQYFVLKNGIKVTDSAFNGATLPVLEATVLVSYRALRKDLAGDMITITSQDVATANFGDIDVDNPISVAGQLITAAMGATLTYKAITISSDDNNGYNEALDILSRNEDVYVIVPLTQDKDVISAYASHCTAMSMPEKSRWRVVYGSSPVPVTKILVNKNHGYLMGGTKNAVTNTYVDCYIRDFEGGAFISQGCRAGDEDDNNGDFIDIYEDTADGSVKYRYSLRVQDVLSDNVVKCYAERWEKNTEGYDRLWIRHANGTEEGGSQYAIDDDFSINYLDSSIRYEVVRVLDTQGQADAISGIATSYDNKRLRLVFPDYVELSINSVDYLVPSYYLCVSLGAMRAGYPPHQGFSTMGISGIKKLSPSYAKPFSDDQLADMAGNGVFWVCQDGVESLPYVLYQTTTDTDSLEVAEDSCVATIDYASKFYKNNLKSVLGKYNVNQISLNYVTNIINACSDQMTTITYERIGPVLTSAVLTSCIGEGDKIKPTIKIQIPYPVNGVDVTLQI